MVRNSEDNFVERKTVNDAKDFKKTIVAFANSVIAPKEAILFIGVFDDGTAQRVQGIDKLQKKIRHICEEECYPKIIFKSEVLPIEGNEILAVIISESDSKPHFAGPAYVRVGSETKKASKEVYNDLISSRMSVCREILKYKDKLVTVTVLNKYLGSTKILSGPSRTKHECRVERCNSQYITLYDCNTKRADSEPIKNLSLSFDNDKSRLEILVEPK